MKKVLSIILALLLVVSPTVCAVPSIQPVGAETPKKILVASDLAKNVAELNAITVNPGLNILTGTTELLDAEGASANISEWSSIADISGFNPSTAAIMDNPVKDSTNMSDKTYSVKANIGSASVTNTTYPGYRIVLPTPISSDRPIYTSVKTAKVNTAEHVNGAFFWVLGATSVKTKEVSAFNISTNDGWKSFDSVMNYTVTDADNNVVNLDAIKFQHTDYAGNVNPTTFCYDDMGLFPAYKITYYNQDGSQVIAIDYAILDENGDIITSYKPKTYISGDTAYTEWSETISGNVTKSVSLNNEDVSLYAVGTSVPVKEITATKYGLGKIGSESMLTAVLGDGVSVDEEDITWSVSGTAVKISSSSKGSNVSVTAVEYGSSDVTVDISGSKKTITIKVLNPTEFEFNNSSDAEVFTGADVEHLSGGSVKITSDTETTFTFAPGVDVKYSPNMVIRAKDLGTDAALSVSFGEWNESIELMSGIADYNEFVVDLSPIIHDFASTDSLTFSLAAASNIEIDSIAFYPEFDSESYLSLDTSATYLTGTSETVAVMPVIESNITHVDKSIIWDVYDENGVANVDINDNGAVVSSKAGSGLITVTATLESDASKSESIDIYVSDTYSNVDTIVVIEASSNVITKDAERVTVTGKAFSKNKNADDGVTFSYNDDSIARVAQNNNGCVVLEAMTNGTLVVTAASVSNNSVTANISIKIANQREKYASYNIRYLATGNSFLNHSAFDGWTWSDPENGSRGMAASLVENDYFHKTQYYLANSDDYKAKVTAKQLDGSGFESYVSTDRTAKDYLDHSYITSLKNQLETFKPNIFTIQLAENVKCDDNEALELFYDTFYGFVAKNKPEDCIVVVITLFGLNNRSKATIKMAEKYGFLVNDMTFVNTYNGLSQQQNPYYAFLEYPDFSPSQRPDKVEFRTHPGDYGHNAIAEGNIEQINKLLTKTLTPEFIYLPTSLEISGDNFITSENGTSKYAVKGDRDNVDTTVIWSVDNENIATITDDGLLTAVNNGTVIVKATSVYDSDVYTTKAVTVTGQTPCYTVTYAAGADDESIAGLPESFAYAKGEYVLSAASPTRNGYKFAGWSLAENGTVITTATITANTTVYAVWKVADNWTFETDGNFEGITIGAFNTSVKDGVASGISYEGGLAVVASELILDSANYEKLRVVTSFSSDEENQELTAKITTTVGEYNFKVAIEDAQMNEYVFSVANLEGTITGFEIKPSMLECSISLDEIEFTRCPAAVRNLRVQRPNMSVNAGDATYYIKKLTISSGASITFKNGTFVIGEIDGDASVITLSDANLITSAQIEGYASVNLGPKEYESNIRYLQINGVTTEMNERSNTLGLICDKETIAVVTEKEGDTFVSVAYYCFNNGTAGEIDIFKNALTAKQGASLRTDEYTGIRFRAGITHSARNTTDGYNITEYGYIVARKDQLTSAGAELNFDFPKIISGTAYVKNESGAVDKDYVFDTNNTEIIFTGLMTNIPQAHYNTKLVARPYMRIKTVNGTHVVYGDSTERSIYEVAKAVLADPNNGLTDEELDIVNNIINKAQPDNEIFFPADDLYK